MIDQEPHELTWLESIVEKTVKEINNEEWNKLMYNNPDSVTLYTYEIDIDTLKTEATEQRVEDYEEEYVGYAEFEESLQGRRIYAESLCSAQDARQLVLDFCEKFLHAGAAIIREMNI